MYHLQKYRSLADRHTCPQCNKKHSFALYVDDDGIPIAENVGRCNHENACGYHYTPKEYFSKHPNNTNHSKPYRAIIKLLQPLKIDSLPFGYVTQSKSLVSDLFEFISNLFGVEVTKQVFNLYHIGATNERDVIYWQIDANNHVRTGKIMKYNKNTGKRIKGDVDRINWVHSKLKKNGIIAEDWTLTQCLFGEHLIKTYPNKNIAIVESEKTALICAIVMPQYIWLASGGCSNLQADKLKVLQGKTVVLFPDVDAFSKWSKIAQSATYCNVIVSGYLNRNATDEDRANKIDIADLIIKDSITKIQ